MDINLLIVEKFKSLITEGHQTIQKCGWDGSRYYKHPSDIDYRRFRTEAMNLVRRVCGENSDHYMELKRIAETKEMAANSFYYKDCLGVLEAARNDYQGGYLLDLKSLVAAELLGDFLEQAEFLLSNGYYVPAASLAGAVLEDTLRKLCEKNNISIPEKTKIDRLNTDLVKAQIYTLLVQKRITALADIRNNADHGHTDKFKKEDVEDMVAYVRRFATEHLG